MLKSYEAYDLRKKIFCLNSEGKAAYFRGSYTSINSTFSGLSLNDTYLITAEEALNLILLERRKELVGRGTRWFDLRRLNLENDKQIVLIRNLNGVE